MMQACKPKFVGPLSTNNTSRVRMQRDTGINGIKFEPTMCALQCVLAFHHVCTCFSHLMELILGVGLQGSCTKSLSVLLSLWWLRSVCKLRCENRLKIQIVFRQLMKSCFKHCWNRGLSFYVCPSHLLGNVTCASKGLYVKQRKQASLRRMADLF